MSAKQSIGDTRGVLLVPQSVLGGINQSALLAHARQVEVAKLMQNLVFTVGQAAFTGLISMTMGRVSRCCVCV